MPESAGFIGLGNMGEPMAANLLRAGSALRVYNRTASKAAALARQGAVPVSRPDEAAERGGIVFTMVSDDQALEDVCLGPQSFVESLGPAGLHVSMSTIAPATARRLAKHHADRGVDYLAMPVFGRPEAAASKKLWILLSGRAEAKKRAQPFVAAMGQGSFDFGEDPGAANVAKLCGNFLIAAAIEAIGEALALAEKSGLDRLQVIDMIGKTLFACPVYQGYGKQIARHDYDEPEFRLPLGLKDVSLVLQTAAACSMPMPLANLARDRCLTAISKGRENLDWSAAALGVSEDAGLPLQG